MNLIKLKTKFENMCPGWKLSSVSREDNFVGDSLLLESSTFRFQVDGFKGKPSRACKGMCIQHISLASQQRAKLNGNFEELLARKIYLGVKNLVSNSGSSGPKKEKSPIVVGYPREPCRSKLHLVVDNTQDE